MLACLILSGKCLWKIIMVVGGGHFFMMFNSISCLFDN